MKTYVFPKPTEKRHLCPSIYIQTSKYIQPALGIEIAKYVYFFGFRLSIHVYKLRITISTHTTVRGNK